MEERAHCQHDYDNPRRVGRAHWVCRGCGRDITVRLFLAGSLLSKRHADPGSLDLKREKGRRRGKFHRGESHGRSKLTEADVIEIIKALNEGSSLADLGKKHGVKSSTIRHIEKGRSWKHIER